MKLLKAIRKATWTHGVLVIAFLLAVLAAIFLIRAKDIGNRIGDVQGKIVGTAIGSWNGITEGRREGTAAGEAAGLSAEDTTADIKGYIQQVGKLQVLTAKITNKLVNGIGGNSKSYMALYVDEGTAVFTVDLEKISVTEEDDGTGIVICVPHSALELELFWDGSKQKKIAEYEKSSWSLSAKDGIEEYANTLGQSDKKTKETLENDPDLMSRVKETAKEQIKRLAESACGNRHDVTVEVEEKESK